MKILEPNSGQSGVWNDYARAGYSTWPPGMECEVHSHRDAVEFFVFLAGECDFITDAETIRVRGGQTVYVEPGEKHKLKAVGDRHLEMFMAILPNHSPTHTFYREDGTPVDWDRRAPGSQSDNPRPMGLTREDLKALGS